jgi:hypothetical protein
LTHDADIEPDPGALTTLNALEHRVDTGHWSASAAALNTAVAHSGLGAAEPYVTFRPPALANARSCPRWPGRG